MGIIEITLGLLLAVALVGAIGKWLPVPLPLLQVGAGVALSYLPAFGSLSVPPEVFFLLFIPPLLFAEAWVIPKRDLVGALRPVLLLAFGLVLFTVLGVGYLLHWLVPELPLRSSACFRAALTTAAVANLHATRPEASLIRLSPLTIVATRAGILSLPVTALTATASVGETT